MFSWSAAFQHWRAGRIAAAAEPILQVTPTTFEPTLEGCSPLLATEPPRAVSARAIAFYLPQFHPIPENDKWWGEGFTEWTKVRGARPLFLGHDQPREPGELGYYDLLRDDDAMRRQAELAQLHGISGFCFYFYWFAGTRLLEAPIQKYVADKAIGLPFCLCWANENWTRRWDGKDKDVLIAQHHSPEDDIAFIRHVSQYFTDPRYIRVNGRPLLLVYRPALLPSAEATAERWRSWLLGNGFGEVYLAYTQAFEHATPREYGFDAAIEFPPNNSGLPCEPDLVQGMVKGASISVYDWRKLAVRARMNPPPQYTLFRGVNPNWDNTPRRPDGGAVFINATPSGFKTWLAEVVRDTIARFHDPDERLIFINAWNEWGEGAHLEPDKKHGFAWLEAARRALDVDGQAKIIVVTHDLHRHGAQYVALNIARTLKRQFGVEIACISGADGELAPDFEREGPLTVLDPRTTSPDAIDEAVRAIAAKGFGHAIVNSAASAWIAPRLTHHKVRMIGLVHELPNVITSMGLAASLKQLDSSADAIVFPTETARDQDAAAVRMGTWRNPIVLPQGVYKASTIANAAQKEAARTRVNAHLGLPNDAHIVLGVGYADLRKGVDIFIAWALAAARRWPNLHFVWLGKIAQETQDLVARALAEAGQQQANIHFLGFIEDTADFYAAARIYALSSREDPFPSTALEALAAATPVIMMRGAGGIETLATYNCVKTVVDANPEAFIAAAAPWVEVEHEARAAGEIGRAFVQERLGFASYTGALLDLLRPHTPRVSAVVPNYNYAHHLEQRLRSILEQTLAPREILVLDDASSDDSVAVVERVLAHSPINWRIIRNQVNSGSVFAQWSKGVELARHDLVWIAEADDWADRHFLEAATAPFQRRDVVLSMTQSRQADAQGRIIADDYLDYVRDVSATKWTRAFIGEGLAEVRAGLSIKNTIPNASAVLFRREALLRTLAEHAVEINSYRVTGDWCVYVNMLRHGALAFTPAALNYHRRHDASVTISRFGLAELAELARMQSYIAREFAPGQETSKRARAYLLELVEQFGLAQRFTATQIEDAMEGVVLA
ncbi:MAG: glycoside hydrolase family 99-like domain-containing protein [Hyphomonadaceae bacterium]|nr:glycoside hydrolase family 99-like domain-containing protein [Hyphomonadaceae bacterium]